MYPLIHSILSILKIALLCIFLLLSYVAISQTVDAQKKDSLAHLNAQALHSADTIRHLFDTASARTKNYLRDKKNSITKIAPATKKDTLSPLPKAPQSLRPDSARRLADSASKAARAYFRARATAFSKSVPSLKSDSSLFKGLKPNISFNKDSLTKKAFMKPLSASASPKKPPLIRINSGFVSYNLSFRSSTDTPFDQGGLTQHQLSSSLRVTVAGKIPLIVSAYVRRSNSPLFPAITDIQAQFDAAAYRDQLSAALRKKLMEEEKELKDSISQKEYALKQLQAKNLKGWLFSTFTISKLTDAREIVHVPQKSYDMRLPDSSNKKRADSLEAIARLFIALYDKTVGEYKIVSKEADSLKNEYEGALKKDKQYKKALDGQMPSLSGYPQWKSGVEGSTGHSASIPQQDRWLLGVRSFSIGRSNVSYSDLTVKNISLMGFNFEYNSWYYLAAAAGSVDYRFMDFRSTPVQRPHQYLYTVRAGLGRLEKNFFILTAYRGQKQVYPASGGIQPQTLDISGLSAEAKLQLNRNSYLLGEVAESFSPGLIVGPTSTKSSWSLSDKSNKALSLKFSSIFPRAQARIEAMYKFAGADFQSFNSFQANAQSKSWYVKAEKSLLKRKLKISASLRENDYANPYIQQGYNTNMVFKSLSLAYRQKGWPVITLAYMPMSQLTVVGTQVVQDQFQTLNASVSQYYKIGQQRASTSIVLTRFFNSSSDTGFIYYNASSLFIGHTLYFNRVTGSITVSHTQNNNYRYDVMDEGFTFQVFKKGSLGGGAKINNLNRVETKLGGYASMSLLVGRRGSLSLRYEDGYLPGNGNRLARNTMGNISFTKYIK